MLTWWGERAEEIFPTACSGWLAGLSPTPTTQTCGWVVGPAPGQNSQNIQAWWMKHVGLCPRMAAPNCCRSGL